MCRCGFSFGYAHGVPPYGYRAENASLVEIAEEQAVITMMCGMRAKGSILKGSIAEHPKALAEAAAMVASSATAIHPRGQRRPVSMIRFRAQQSLKMEKPLPSGCAAG